MALHIQDKINIVPKNLDCDSNTKELEEMLLFSPYPSKICFLPYMNFLKNKVKDSVGAEKMFTQNALAAIENEADFKNTFDSKKELSYHQDLINFLLSGLFPMVGKGNLLTMVNGPFELDPFYISPALEKIFSDSKGISQLTGNTSEEITLKYVWAGCHILNLHYGQNITDHRARFYFKMRPKDNGSARYFTSELKMDFVDVKLLKPLKPLSSKDIDNLLNNIHDQELWEEMLPRENFEFRGFIIGQLFDVSEEEAISYLKQKLLEKDALTNKNKIQPLQEELRILLENNNLQIGITALDYPDKSIMHQYKIRYNLLADFCEDILDVKYSGSIYEEACRRVEPILIPDLTELTDRTELEERLIESGLRTLIIYPLLNEDQKILGLIEVACPQANSFNSFSLFKLNKVSSLFSLAMERSREEVNNRIEAVIREEYTTLHSSVEWKFIEQAYDLMNKRDVINGDPAQAAPIRFPEVYPLFGQADIVGSSILRNEAIRSDLSENLKLAESVLLFAKKRTKFPLTELHLQEVQYFIQLLTDRYQTSDESEIVEFLQIKIHPYFVFLRGENKRMVRRINLYFNKLDENFQIIYKERKSYEMSVSMLNKRMESYLEKQQKKAQKIIPHYFEKYATDGVEFEIYTGNSISKSKKFTDVHLHNLRLWQLETLCQITKGVADMRDKLPVPLTTAQLIFVYSQPVSIRFRLDEKHFDVDGAYNVRYKILKKRIDKAVVKDTGERVTVSGKIAIVYTTDRDRLEYMEYLVYLKKKGLIIDEIEDLDIAPLQGVDGLRALRIKVAE